MAWYNPLSWFRKGPKIGVEAAKKPALMTITKAAEDLVVRSRAGDQNAMGALVELRKAADAGSARAKMGLGLVKRYISAHPVDGFGEEGAQPKPLPAGWDKAIKNDDTLVRCVLKACEFKDGTLACVTVLACGEALTAARVQELGLSCFPRDEHTKAFYDGIRHPREGDVGSLPPDAPQDVARAYTVGQVIGAARAIQKITRVGAPLSEYDPVIGWEMGE